MPTAGGVFHRHGPTDSEKRPNVTTAVAPSPQFTAFDRCDRCGAQAYVRVELASGGELMFCAHHAREHADKLQQIASMIHDETGTMGQRSQMSSEGP